MCGIAGFFGQTTPPEQAMQTSLTALASRGPDAQGWVAWSRQDTTWQVAETLAGSSAAMLHTRLSIMDTRAIANQPMQAPGRNIWICYNGEIYDWQAEAECLTHQGVRFNSHSDTEFILQAYLQWGFEATLEKMRGMFALSIVDLEQQKLYCARDRFGLKPLLYHYDGQQFAYGSVLCALAPLLTSQNLRLNPAAIDAYLAHRYIPAPMTVYQNVQRLENGHSLELDLRTMALKKRQYWQPEAKPGDFEELLEQAIRVRTVADRPIGVFLSSGVDSSAIVCHLQDQAFENIHAFTAAFPGSNMDESQRAEQIAKRIGLPHSRIEVPRSISADFDRIVADLDEPFADPSAFPTWYLAREASKTVKVVLSGDGGDELFAGYKRYAKHMRSAFRRNWSLPLLPLKANLDFKGKDKLFSECRLTWQDAYALRFSGFSINQRLALLTPDYQAQAHYWRNEADPPTDSLKALLEVDRNNYLPEYILRKTDLTTMAHGLEARAPLLDHHLYETVLALDDAKRFTQPAKSIFDNSLARLGELNPLQDKKRGFNPPLSQWLDDDLAERRDGLGQRLQQQSDGLLKADAIDDLAYRYYQGNRSYAEQLLQLLILDCSLQQLPTSNP